MEKYHYYVTYSFVNTEGRLRITCRYIERDSPIETKQDVQSLIEDAVFGNFKAITVLDWKRLQ